MSNPLFHRYHDEEWGVPAARRPPPLRDADPRGCAGRAELGDDPEEARGYRKAYDNFDARKIARYDAARSRALLADDGIVRNRLKIAASIRQRPCVSRGPERSSAASTPTSGGLSEASPGRTPWESLKQLPARTAESDAMSRGSAEARIPVRRLDDLLRVHAGGGDGQRPHDGLLPPQGRGAHAVAAGSGGEALEAPRTVPLPLVPDAIVQTGLALLPEFDGTRGDAKSTPVGRPGDFDARVLRLRFFVPPVEFLARRRLALRRGPRSDLVLDGTAVEVGVRLLVGETLTASPSIRTCRPSGSQWKTSATYGLPPSSIPLRDR